MSQQKCRDCKKNERKEVVDATLEINRWEHGWIKGMRRSKTREETGSRLIFSAIAPPDPEGIAMK